MQPVQPASECATTQDNHHIANRLAAVCAPLDAASREGKGTHKLFQHYLLSPADEYGADSGAWRQTVPPMRDLRPEGPGERCSECIFALLFTALPAFSGDESGMEEFISTSSTRRAQPSEEVIVDGE